MLRLSLQDASVANLANINTMIGPDVERIMISFHTLSYLYVSPMVVGVATYMIWRLIGSYSILALGMMLLIFPLGAICGKFTTDYRQRMAEQTDLRVKITAEMLTSMRVIKMYAWERAFSRMISAIRHLEVEYLFKSHSVLGVLILFCFTSTLLTNVITFVAYQLTGHDVDAYKVFVTLGYLYIVRLHGAYFFAIGMSKLGEAKVAANRIQSFLEAKELKHTPSPIAASTQCKDMKPRISMTSASFEWLPGKSILQNVSISVDGPSLFGVAGPVGCGKSTLLTAILGELAPSSGSVSIQGTTAYSPQEAWIISTTVRENIVFGKQFNSERYQQVLTVCALIDDLEEMPLGDETLVGCN
jgi:ATP-binding cassette, subfamily C (CFTR/MRP), member 4